MPEEQKEDRSAQFTVRCAYKVPSDVARIHQYMVGSEVFDVTLYSNKATPMPEEFARQFLQDSFEVCDEDGMILRGPSRGRKSSVIEEGMILRADETIARLDELTITAMVARANLISGGEKFKKNSKRPMVLQFLIDAAEDKAVEMAESTGTLDEDMSDDEATAMLGSSQSAVDRALTGA